MSIATVYNPYEDIEGCYNGEPPTEEDYKAMREYLESKYLLSKSRKLVLVRLAAGDDSP